MKKTMLGVEENVANLLCYVLGWVSGLVVILIEKKNQTVRFHAVQSMILFGGLTVFSVVFSMLFYRMYFVVSLINLGAGVLWIVLMIKAYQKEEFVLPIISDLAKQWEKKIKI